MRRKESDFIIRGNPLGSTFGRTEAGRSLAILFMNTIEAAATSLKVPAAPHEIGRLKLLQAVTSSSSLPTQCAPQG